jgi:hypothetical protein
MPARVVAPTSVKAAGPAHRAGGRAFADHDVDLVILQRRVEDFLHHRRHAVDLVDEEHVVGFEIGQQAARSPARSSTGPEVWRRFTPISRAMMWARWSCPGRAGRTAGCGRAARRACGGRDEDFQLGADLFLADVFVQLLGPQGALDGFLVGRAGVAEMMRCSEKSSVWMLML